MQLDKENFSRIIDATPLVSIDLIVQNERKEVLLGQRLNRPAQGYWFVPGGRIRKNEPLQQALSRIALNELGIPAGAGQLLGAFDHFYDDNFLGVPDISTHYVALAYVFEIAVQTQLQPDQQHSQLRWWKMEQLLESNEVHPNTKLYFQSQSGNGFRCEKAGK